MANLFLPLLEWAYIVIDLKSMWCLMVVVMVVMHDSIQILHVFIGAEFRCKAEI